MYGDVEQLAQRAHQVLDVCARASIDLGRVFACEDGDVLPVRRGPDCSAGQAVNQAGAEVVTSRVPDQPARVPVLQPTPVAWTVTECAPGATGDQGLKALSPGASGSEIKMEPSRPMATDIDVQLLDPAVNWIWAIWSVVMVVENAGSQTSPVGGAGDVDRVTRVDQLLGGALVGVQAEVDGLGLRALDAQAVEDPVSGAVAG